MHETRHTRTSYQVDFYALHTGDTEPVAVYDPRDGTTITVQRLVRPFDVFTCAECYPQPQVQAERERLFRPERAAELEAEA